MKPSNSDIEKEKQRLKELLERSARIRKENKLTKQKLEELKHDTDELLNEQQQQGDSEKS